MKDLILYDDAELMGEVKADNMFAFDILYRRYSKRLYKFGYSILKSGAETENLIQDVYMNLWENRTKIEKDSSVKYYLFTIAYNSAISVMRKKARESEFIEYLKSLPETDEDPAVTSTKYSDLSDKLNMIINELPQRQKEVFLLHRSDGLKYNEIAEILNISLNTVENHMSRALKTIRLKLKPNSLLSLLFFILFV